MKKAIRDHARDFAAIIGLVLVSALVGGFILAKQRLTLPSWVPLAGSDFETYRAALPTAQSITPGQGQTVNVAGVPVGEITKVDLVDGRAVVSMKIRKRYTPIYKDATILVRPKTGLNDIVLELSPGSRASGLLADDGQGTIPVSQTLPQVNLDEILAGLDGDTRSYLQLLIGGAGQGLGGQGKQLSATFKRLEPTGLELKRVTSLLQKRRANVSRSVRNLRLLSEALAGKDEQLSSLIDSSNAVFRAFANQDDRLRETLTELPTALQATHDGLGKVDRFAKVLGPTLGNILPAARALGPTLEQTRPALKQTTPVLRDQLRPFARDTRPAIQSLRPTAAGLAKITPDLTSSLKVVNYLFNTLAYDKKGDGQDSYLFWASWANHVSNALFGTADANGPTRKGLVQISCLDLNTLSTLIKVNSQLGLLTKLLNPVDLKQFCPEFAGLSTTATAASARAGDSK